MKPGIVDAVSNHPITAGVATTIMGIPIVDIMDLASNVTTLIAGCMGIAVSFFFIQYHRSNIRLNEYRLKKMQEDDD
jgi:hypothetical protein